MKFTNLLKNVLGPVINKRVVALFVDDFGSIRVKDKVACSRILGHGIPDHIYLRDTLASEQDLNAIFETLRSIRDCNNHPLCFTPFVIMGNPDFERIKHSGYQKYYREPFINTLQRYGKGYEHAFDLWKEGRAEGIFIPAFHGIEHLNVKKWMKALQSGHKSTLLGFENESVCIPSYKEERKIEGLVKACDIEKCTDIDSVILDLEEGVKIFKTLFNEQPELFTPGAGTYSPLMEKGMYQCGIKYIDTSRYKAQPLGDGKVVKQFHYLGQHNKFGQRYIVRNCAFEPVKLCDCAIDTCIDQIGAAFMMHKPAIISSHRLNYIGHFDESNRTENLKRLKTLLGMVKKRWPDVEFVSGKDICKLYQ